MWYAGVVEEVQSRTLGRKREFRIEDWRSG
jgi:hypothetical protein